MFSTTKIVVGFLSFALFATGCAASATEPTAQSDSDFAVTPSQAHASLETGTFQLFAEPNAPAPKACDVHSQLTFTNNGNSTHAQLKDVVQGPCAIYVIPNVRDFDLKVASNACGALTFQGETSVGGKTTKVAITDSRNGGCAEKAEAGIIVDVVNADGSVSTQYSAN